MTQDNLPTPVLAWLADVLGSPLDLTSAERLNGSSSATLYALQRASGEELVLRLYTKAEWLAEEPDVPLHEAANLRLLASAGLPAPRLVSLDADGSRCGVPAVLMTRLPGMIHLLPADQEDWLRQLAGFLPRLHAISPAGHPWKHSPYQIPGALSVPDWTSQPDVWQRAIRIVSGPLPAYRPTFIHRDYHPVNMLFENGRLYGLVDWANACVGPASVDVAHCRINLVSMYGLAVCDRFLALCQESMAGYWEYDPIWDLVSFFDVDPAHPAEVYQPWIDYGLTYITPELVMERDEEYLASLMARIDAR